MDTDEDESSNYVNDESNCNHNEDSDDNDNNEDDSRSSNGEDEAFNDDSTLYNYLAYKHGMDGVIRQRTLRIGSYECFNVPGMASISSNRIPHEINGEGSLVCSIKTGRSSIVGHQMYVMGGKQLKNSHCKGKRSLKMLPLYVSTAISGNRTFFLSDANQKDFQKAIESLDAKDYTNKFTNCRGSSLVMRIESYYKIDVVGNAPNPAGINENDDPANPPADSDENHGDQCLFHVDAATFKSIPVKRASRLSVCKNYLELIGQCCDILKNAFSPEDRHVPPPSPQAKVLTIFAAEVLAYCPGTPSGYMAPGRMMRQVRAALDMKSVDLALHIPPISAAKDGVAVELKPEEKIRFGGTMVGLDPQFLLHPAHIKKSMKLLLDHNAEETITAMARLKTKSSNAFECVRRCLTKLEKQNSFYVFTKDIFHKKLALAYIIEELCCTSDNSNKGQDTSLEPESALRILNALAKVFWTCYLDVMKQDLNKFKKKGAERVSKVPMFECDMGNEFKKKSSVCVETVGEYSKVSLVERLF